MTFVLSQLIKPDANDSTFSTGARPRSARFSDQIWSHAALTRFSYQTTRTMIQRRNKRLFGCQPPSELRREKRTGCREDSPVFWRMQKKNRVSDDIFSASINLKFWNVILFFFLNSDMWCSAWRHDLKDLTPLKSKIFPRHLNGHHPVMSTNFFIPVVGCGVKQWWKWVLHIWKCASSTSPQVLLKLWDWSIGPSTSAIDTVWNLEICACHTSLPKKTLANQEILLKFWLTVFFTSPPTKPINIHHHHGTFN